MSDYFERVERQLMSGVEARAVRRRRWPARLAPVAARAGRRGRRRRVPGRARPRGAVAPGTGHWQRRVQPPPDREPSSTPPRGSCVCVSERCSTAPTSHAPATRSSPAPMGPCGGRSTALAAPGRLATYDWEASVLTPNGRTVASQLAADDPEAVELSQGSGVPAPGGAGAGGMTLYRAVLMAVAPQRAARGGSTTCSAPVCKGTLCSPARQRRSRSCWRSTPRGARGGQELVVPAGLVVLEAAPPSFGEAPPVSDPAARFFVLLDHVSLSGRDLTRIAAGRGHERAAGRHVRLHVHGRARIPRDHLGGGAPRRSRERPGADAGPALRDRARRAVGDGSVDRLQGVPRGTAGLRTAPTSRPASRCARRASSPRWCGTDRSRWRCARADRARRCARADRARPRGPCANNSDKPQGQWPRRASHRLSARLLHVAAGRRPRHRAARGPRPVRGPDLDRISG